MRISPLAAVREERGWRQIDLAAAARCPIELVRRVEHGQVARVRIEQLVRLAHALGVAPVDLIPGLGARPGTAAVR